MALRYNVDKAFIRTYYVATANTVLQGVPVMLSGTDIVQADTDDDLYIGVSWATEDGTWPAAAGDAVQVVMRGSPCCIPVRSTAAGCTAGAFCCAGTNGVVDVTIGGAVICNTVGQLLETATADGELVGCNVGAYPPSVTAA